VIVVIQNWHLVLAPQLTASRSWMTRIICAQVLRYCHDPAAVPLWPSPDGIPSAADIPECSSCGAPRQFEFQVCTDCTRVAMPRLPANIAWSGLSTRIAHDPTESNVYSFEMHSRQEHVKNTRGSL